MVVEIEVTPKRKPETYERDAQTDLSGNKIKLGKINEEDEDYSDDDNFAALVNKPPEARRRSTRAVTTGIVPGNKEDSDKKPRLSIKE